MIKMIAAVSSNGVIGKDGKIPWNYPEDMKFFRKMTAGGTVIMGRKTWESIGRLLPKRRNIVISRNKVDVEGLETFSSVEEAVIAASFADIKDATSSVAPQQPMPDVWLIGGASIYSEGMKFANEIYVTLLPDEVSGEGVVHFPWINPNLFGINEFIELEDSKLEVARYVALHHGF